MNEGTEQPFFFFFRTFTLAQAFSSESSGGAKKGAWVESRNLASIKRSLKQRSVLKCRRA